MPKTGGVAAAQTAVGALLLSQAFGQPLPTCHEHSKAQRPLGTVGFTQVTWNSPKRQDREGLAQALSEAQWDLGMMCPFHGKLIALHPSQEELDEEDREFPRITEWFGLEIFSPNPPAKSSKKRGHDG